MKKQLPEYTPVAYKAQAQSGPLPYWSRVEGNPTCCVAVLALFFLLPWLFFFVWFWDILPK